MLAKISIGIIILNYQSHNDTKKIVAALQLQSVSNMQILIVDNNSPNNSYEKLRTLETQYTNLKVIKTVSNLGYAKGNNFGLAFLEEHVKPDYVAILNNDIILPNDCFEKLILKYTSLENPAIIAPKQLNERNEELLPYKINSFFDDFLYLFMLFRPFHRKNALRYKDNTGQRAMRVPMIAGSFMFSAFETFKSLGYFYPNTFLFAEERFIALKVKEMKLNNYILLDDTYVHAHSKTINTEFNIVQKNKLLYESWLEFTRVCRSHGKIKSAILRPFMKLSLIEIRLLYKIKSLFDK